jgi:hypothetical protein
VIQFAHEIAQYSSVNDTLIDADEMFVLFNESAEKHLTYIHSIKWSNLLWSTRDYACTPEISGSWYGKCLDDIVLCRWQKLANI